MAAKWGFRLCVRLYPLGFILKEQQLYPEETTALSFRKNSFILNQQHRKVPLVHGRQPLFLFLSFFVPISLLLRSYFSPSSFLFLSFFVPNSLLLRSYFSPSSFPILSFFVPNSLLLRSQFSPSPSAPSLSPPQHTLSPSPSPSLSLSPSPSPSPPPLFLCRSTWPQDASMAEFGARARFWV